MSVRRFFERVLNMEHWVCDYDGLPLKFPYKKLAMWDQYPYLTPKWYTKSLLGNNQVLRFHNQECFRKFATEGRLIELENQKTRK